MTKTKVVLGTAGVLGGLAAAVIGGLVVSMPDGVDGPGAMLAELQGHTDTAGYPDAANAPRELVPFWARSAGTDVVVVRPGEAAGDDGGSRRVDMTWDGTLPADCTDLPQTGMPFDGGGSWPDLAGEQARLCQGWVTVLHDGHLYAWTDDATLTGT